MAQTIKELEKIAIQEAVNNQKANETLRDLADVLGFSERTLYRKLIKYDIKYNKKSVLQNPKTKQLHPPFEYHSIHTQLANVDLNKLGKDGWELVSVIYESGWYRYYFKRKML